MFKIDTRIDTRHYKTYKLTKDGVSKGIVSCSEHLVMAHAEKIGCTYELTERFKT